ncbi:MAG: DUF1418 family protein [Methylotenera sp.]|nr:DUF1418 family protein [Methylotenera sp.]
MQQNKSGLKLPINLIVLDFIGTILIALGLIKMFGGIDVIPSQYLLDDNGLMLILVGACLMLPFILFMIQLVRDRAEQRLIK